MAPPGIPAGGSHLELLDRLEDSAVDDRHECGKEKEQRVLHQLLEKWFSWPLVQSKRVVCLAPSVTAAVSELGVVDRKR